MREWEAPAATEASREITEVLKQKNKAKTRKLSRRDKLALADAARKYASAEGLKLPIGEVRINPESLRIIKSFSIPELIEMVQAAQPKREKGRPVSAKTQLWIERLRDCRRSGRGYLHLASEFRPKLSKEKAQAAIKNFRNYWKQQIES